MQQNQDIKGFTLLELLVVIVIISVVSAVGYPKFTSWKKDREIRYAAEKVANLLTSISTQAQRGSYPFVQFYINPSGSKVEFITKGQTPENFNTNLNVGKKPECSTKSSGVFDNNEFDKYDSEDEKISVQMNLVGTVCFSQNGTYFKEEGRLHDSNNPNVSIEGRLSNNYVIICSKDNAAATGNKCATTKGDGLEKPAYLVEWSRFGNISKFKWSGSVWTRQ